MCGSHEVNIVQTLWIMVQLRVSGLSQFWVSHHYGRVTSWMTLAWNQVARLIKYFANSRKSRVSIGRKRGFLVSLDIRPPESLWFDVNDNLQSEWLIFDFNFPSPASLILETSPIDKLKISSNLRLVPPNSDSRVQIRRSSQLLSLQDIPEGPLFHAAKREGFFNLAVSQIFLLLEVSF